MNDAADPLKHSRLHEVDGNMIRIVPDGPERWRYLIDTINAARTELCLFYYTFSEDDSGRAVRDALIAAQGRGVRTVLMIDSFGSNETSDEFFEPLRAAGGWMRWFGTRWTPQYLIRNHQKLLIADRKTVICGGFNIDDTYFAPATAPPAWQDMGVIINGPVVEAFSDWFDQLEAWMRAARPRFRHLRALVRNHDGGRGAVRLLIGGPTVRLSPWARALRTALTRAKHVSISTAYFSPNAGFLRRLGRVLKRGGRVELVLPAHSDNSATIGASRLLYNYLLKRGTDISEFEPCRLHNKICVIDDVVMIGSANLDMRSLYINMELMVQIDDADLARSVRAIIDAQRAQSTQIAPQLHATRATFINRLRWAAAWFVVGIVDYGVTRRLNFGLPPAK